MKVCQVTLGRYHHFDLARQLELRGVLERVITAYPRFKIRNEDGIPAGKIRSFPWIYAPFMARRRFGIHGGALDREWEWWSRKTLDYYAAANLGDSNVLIALASCGLRAGRRMKSRGGYFICDRGSTDVRFQDAIMREEYARWDIPFRGVDPRVIAKEEAEYELADRITVPSEFARRTYLDRGLPAEKVCRVPLGVRLDSFRPVGNPDPDRFVVLYVGGVSVRKGFLYLLEAFRKFRHPGKRMIVVGQIQAALRPFLDRLTPPEVEFRSHIPNGQLAALYSSATVCVLPSIEDGFGMVVSEALACGCPVIVSENTGAAELLSGGAGGFVVPIRDAEAITRAFENLQDAPPSREKVAMACPRTGWDGYGTTILGLLKDLFEKPGSPESMATASEVPPVKQDIR